MDFSQYFYRVDISFKCPYCHAQNDAKAAAMLNEPNRDEAAHRATQIPVKCASCKRERPVGIVLKIDVNEITPTEFEALQMPHDSPTNM